MEHTIHPSNIGKEEFDGNNQLNMRKARERELERKRMRGEASCAECRRLKLKCDKQVPCASCVRRGCPTICPNGTLATGQGTRFVLANTDKLHNKLLEMSKRIRQLEDALQIVQSTISPAPHPLLSEDLLAIKTGVDVSEDIEDPVQESDVFTSFGTLTIAEGGESRFVGRSGSEALMLTAHEDVGPEIMASGLYFNRPQNIPDDLAHLSETFPFDSMRMPKDELQVKILSYLPSWERATALIEAYLENLSWFFKPVDREQIVEELMPRFYNRPRPPDALSPSESGEEMGIPVHEMALLFMVFAWGAVADLTMDPSNDEAELYKHLARAALSMSPVFQGTSMATVQAISMMGAYDFFACRTNTLEVSWKLQSFALCLAASIGLHRDPARWKLPPKIVQRRRSLFWELCALDNWKSLGTGRPAIFHIREVDCEFPEDKEAQIAEDGTIIIGFWRWKHIYGKEVTSQIAEQLCAVRPIKYSEILELDRKIREHSPHPASYARPGPANGLPQKEVHRTMCELFKEISLLFIHRNFFARAMRESPINPLRSPFAPSFLASYASAMTLLRVMRSEFDRSFKLLLRHWPLWAHALAAGVIIGTVAVRDMTSALASTALRELDLAIGLFERASMHPVVKNGIPILRRLRDKARANPHTGHATTVKTSTTSISSSDAAPVVKSEDVDDELLVLGGATRIVKKRAAQSSNTGSPRGSTPSDATGHSPPPAGTPSTVQSIPSAPSTSSIGMPSPPQATLHQDSRTSEGADSTSNLLAWLSTHQSPTQYSRSLQAQSQPQQAAVLNNEFGVSGDTLSPYNLTELAAAEAGSGSQNVSNMDVNNVFQYMYGQATGLPPVDTSTWASQVDIGFDTPMAQFSSPSAPGGPAQFNYGTGTLAQSVPQNAFDPSGFFGKSSFFPTYGGGPMMQDFARGQDTSFSTNYDFTVGEGSDLFMDAMLTAQPDSNDAAVADAWRSIMEDPRFTSLGVDVLKDFGK